MAKQTINIGASPNDGTGTPLRTAFDYTNQNFTELYTATGPSGNNIVVPGSATITGALTVGNGTSATQTFNGVTNILDIGFGSLRGGSAYGDVRLWTDRFRIYNNAGTQIIKNISGTNGDETWYDGAGGTRMTLNATGLGVGGSPFGGLLTIGSTGITSATSATLTWLTNKATLSITPDGATNGAGTTVNYSWANGGQGPLIFRNNAISNVMTLDASGNCGIGVTPSAWGSNYKSIDLVGGGRVFTVTGTGTHGFSFNAFNNNTNWLYQFSTVASRFELQQSGNFAWLIAPSGTAGNAITFTQAMTLMAGGDLLVGTTTNTNASRVFARGTGGATTLAVQSSTGDTANPGVLIGKFDNDSTTSQILVRFTINNNAAGSGQITANGANQAAFGTFSDSRLKKNIVSLPSQLSNILSLRPVEFDYKDGSGHQIGFVAQEMQEVYSDAVGEQNGFLTVTGWSKTEARLVSAIKELAAKVQALEAKLA